MTEQNFVWAFSSSWKHLAQFEYVIDEDCSVTYCYSPSPFDPVETEPFTFLAPPNTLQQVSCQRCGYVVQQAVETTCCNVLVCQECCVDLGCCPCCHLSQLYYSTVANLSVRRMVDGLPVRCDYCSHVTSAGEFEFHFRNCSGKDHISFKQGNV
ncbi:hypothetical protein GEMRC1_003868 [Eukaryota sp. GEM-RC1]